MTWVERHWMLEDRAERHIQILNKKSIDAYLNWIIEWRVIDACRLSVKHVSFSSFGMRFKRNIYFASLCISWFNFLMDNFSAKNQDITLVSQCDFYCSSSSSWLDPIFHCIETPRTENKTLTLITFCTRLNHFKKSFDFKVQVHS